MKLVTFLNSYKEERVGFYINGRIADMEAHASRQNITLPETMNSFLNAGKTAMEDARKVYKSILDSADFEDLSDIKLLAPVPYPPSVRDAYAFEQHVAAARRNRGVEMAPEFYEFPIFYFTNHNAIFGDGDIYVEKDHLLKLDFELEIAAVIGRAGRNIRAEEADDYIAGFTIMNDFSARQLQMEEMKLNLGPAKGKDFATSIGPWLVTPDELEEVAINTGRGKSYDLEMTAYHNEKQISLGNMRDMTFTFAEIIERASYGVDLFPGDVIGSGTVGTGCYLEINGTKARQAKADGADYEPVWLKDGDIIELNVDRLGVLSNRIVYSGHENSILDKKNKSEGAK